MRTALILLIAAGLALCQPAAFAQKTHVIQSPNLHCNDTVSVYSPQKKAGKKSGKRIPTLFLLHGWGGNYRDWGANIDLQSLSNESGFRIICPDGFHDSWYMDKVDSTGMKWRSFFWEELWPQMDAIYGLDADCTFIDGLSMGGHGAMNIFLDHPERFRGAGSMSGVLDLRHSGGSRVLIPPMLGAESIEDAACDAQSAVNRLSRVKDICGESALLPTSKTAADCKPKILVVSCGSLDKTFLPATKEFEEKCHELGLHCIALYSPALHRWPYWVWALPHHIAFFRDAMEDTALGHTVK